MLTGPDVACPWLVPQQQQGFRCRSSWHPEGQNQAKDAPAVASVSCVDLRDKMEIGHPGVMEYLPQGMDR